MKKTTLKRFFALIMALLMVFSMTACDSSSNEADNDAEDDFGYTEEDDDYGSTNVSDSNVLENENLRYVMVYNPNIYDEYASFDSTSLKTGYFGSQIEVESNRADNLDQEKSGYLSYSQQILNEDLPWDKINLDGNRGDGLYYDYNKGDIKEFYVFQNKSMETRALESFECVYAGEYCYIWSVGNIAESDLEKCGKEFDKEIYNQTVDAFGTPRFVGETGKVNLLFYPMMDNLCGCFCMTDIFATGEISQAEIEMYGANTDHAILHMNTQLLEYNMTTLTYSTMAHEFQHLICATNLFSTVNGTMCRTWLNESMSGYIEETLYNGVKEDAGHYDEFNNSARIRNGQSMYNFETDMDMFNFDIGVYGSVYLFSEYLSNMAGKDVFSNIHEYWRDSYSTTLSEAEAMMNAVPASVKTKISNSITYPMGLEFACEEDEWMSKLILDFYLTTLSKDSNIKSFDKIDQRSLVYDELDGADIEGGGRIILRVKDDKFEIPYDADSGLIYIGLDKDFNPVTDFVIK